MSSLSAWSATTIAETLLNPAVVMIGANKIGITKGGQQFDPGVQWGDLEFDGRRTKIKGGARVERYESKITATILQIGKSDGSQLVRLNPGATVDGVSGKVTLRPAGAFVASADYTLNLRLIWEVGDPTAAKPLLAVLFPIALCTKWDIKGGADGEAEIAVEWEAVIDPTTGLTQCPFVLEPLAALPTS